MKRCLVFVFKLDWELAHVRKINVEMPHIGDYFSLISRANGQGCWLFLAKEMRKECLDVGVIALDRNYEFSEDVRRHGG